MSTVSFKEFLLLQEKICPLISDQQLKDLETFGDRLLAKFDIDIEFSKHFKERMSDSRNDPCIVINEIQKLFKKIQKDKGKKVSSIFKQTDIEAILKDVEKELNIPVVLRYDKKNDELDLVLKTVMRKKNFQSPNQSISY